jgi:hypothetical protein
VAHTHAVRRQHCCLRSATVIPPSRSPATTTRRPSPHAKATPPR